MTTSTSCKLPAGATRIHNWEPPHETGDDTDRRIFTGSTRVVMRKRHDGTQGSCGPDIAVEIEGYQWETGRTERWIVAGELHPDNALNIDQARQLGNALLAAADEAERAQLYDEADHLRVSDA